MVTPRAVKITSTVVDSDIWLILDKSFVPNDGLACYYLSEIPILRDETPEELREIHKIKVAFPGSTVVAKTKGKLPDPVSDKPDFSMFD